MKRFIQNLASAFWLERTTDGALVLITYYKIQYFYITLP